MHPDLTRPIYWNVEYAEPFMIPAGILLIAAIVYGLYRKVREWKSLGVLEVRWDRPVERLLRVLRSGLGQKRVLAHRYAGLMHNLIFVGFVLLFIGTCLVAIERDLCQHLFGAEPVAFLHGSFYKAFSFVLDVAGVMVLVGCLLALWRRYVMRPAHLGGKPGYPMLVLFLLAVTVTGFYLEAARIAHSAFAVEGDRIVEIGSSAEKWASPVGYALTRILPAESVSPKVQHAAVWWLHSLLSFGFILGFAYSALRHSILGWANIFFAPFESTGTLRPIPDMEEAESFGVTSVDQFSWKTLFDSDVCVACGRCEIHCPASVTGKPLSPKKVILSINEARIEALGKRSEGRDQETEFPPLVGNHLTEDELWSCTTCGACMHQCPMFIEHIPAIVDVRRSLVMMESRFPEEVQITFENLEKAGNPWGMENDGRADWAKDLDVPTLADEPDAEVLFWVGCAGSFDVRAKPVSRALAKILKAAGVKFAILGPEEQCCGDPARRIGHEYLYSMLAETAVQTMNSYGVRKIVTACPHCFHTIANEYPQLGGNYEVVHHTDLIRDLIQSGRIKLNLPENRISTVYHDSCYLGRHNGLYESPREVIRSAGLPLTEMPRNRSESFCCGAGGGRMWMEEHLGDKKINIERTEEVLATGAQQVAVACPFCKTMLADGTKEKERSDLNVLDIAELVAQALPEPNE